jgi:hypothetical protein
MGTIRFTFSVDGAAQFDRRLFSARLKINDFREVAPGVVQALRDDIFRNFITEGRSANRPFTPINHGYARAKARLHSRQPAQYPGTTILVRTGRLLNSLTSQGGTRDTVLSVTRTGLTYGTRVPWGAKQAKLGRNAIQISRLGRRAIVEAFRDTLIDTLGPNGPTGV